MTTAIVEEGMDRLTSGVAETVYVLCELASHFDVVGRQDMQLLQLKKRLVGAVSKGCCTNECRERCDDDSTWLSHSQQQPI
mmetsp:Transcript_793/g.1871  ORF Transcript_793/g.1871 Transcript_793/m.1871 type:complete len:81 (+) Transcript_793:1257-1499(+)